MKTKPNAEKKVRRLIAVEITEKDLARLEKVLKEFDPDYRTPDHDEWLDFFGV